MKAVVVNQPGPVSQAVISTVADPIARPGQVVVDIKACDVNYPDILYFEGRYQSTPAAPFSPGLGGAGIVSAVGEGIDSQLLGSRVLVLPEYGTYAEKVVTTPQRCFPIPADITFETAAALGLVYQTAYFALTDHGAIREGAKVLVLGATGGIGMAAIQLAKSLGSPMVIAATRGEEGGSYAKALGADAVIDIRMDNLRDGLRSEVQKITGSAGVDIVIDPVGGALSEATLRILAWRGRIVVVGFASGEVPKFPGNYLLVKNVSASGIQWTDYVERQPERVAAAQQHIFALWSEGRLRPEISKVVPLEQFAEPLAELAQGKHRGKSIIRMQTEGM